MEQHKRINKRIKENFGSYSDGRAYFRIALTDQTEMRYVPESQHVDLPWYYGKYTNVPKYPHHFLEPRWAIEGLFFFQDFHLPAGAVGDYYALYVFPLIDGKRAIPPYRAIELFLHLIRYGPKKVASDYMGKEAEDFAKDVALIEAILDNENPVMASNLHDGTAIAVPGNYGG